MALLVIDTGSTQRDLDFAAAFNAGWQDVYVKMGGDNVDTYVAPYYVQQVDRARVVGFRHIGHYWVPNADPSDPDVIDTPTQQADWMCDRLHDFRKASDFIVLDNESLDGAIRFNDGQAAEFINRVKTRLGISGRQVFTYTGWYDGNGMAWPATLGTGTMFIIADYRMSSQPAFNFPNLSTIPRERIVGHQYGGAMMRTNSGGQVATDTNHFTDNAFQWGVPVTLESKARDYARANQRPNTGEASWDQMCGNLMYRFGRFVHGTGWNPRITGPTAWDVALASGGRNMNPAAAPIGAIHWWRNKSGNTPGHTGRDLVGGGTKVFMATWSVAESLGQAIGIQSVAGYSTAKSFMQYEGWTDNYAGAATTGSSLAGLDVVEIIDKPIGDIMARYIWAPGRGGLLITETDGVFLPSMISTNAALSMEMQQMQQELFAGFTATNRQFDVARQDALDRQAAAGKVETDAMTNIVNAAYDKLVAKIDSLDDGLTDDDVDATVLAGLIAEAMKEIGVEVEASVDAEAIANVLLNAAAKRLGE